MYNVWTASVFLEEFISRIPSWKAKTRLAQDLMERYHTEGYPSNGFGLVSGRGRSGCKGSQNLKVISRQAAGAGMPDAIQ